MSPLEGVINFRDVGDHINHLIGQTLLQTGLFFRSARPDAATLQDRHTLVHDLGIKTVVDLRTLTEHVEQTRKHTLKPTRLSILSIAPKETKHPLRIPEIEYKDININGSGYSNALLQQLSYGQRAKLYALYAIGYRKEAISILGANVMAARGLAGLAEDSLEFSQLQVKEVLDVLCQRDAFPVVIHCTQGKDRTGLIVLLVLLALGVPREAIDADYRLSESELLPEREEKLEEIHGMGLPDSFADCPEHWTENVCAWIRERYGGVRAYLLSCGVSQQQLEDLGAILKA